ncbi:MAG: outer membrane beta-barrel protein, partial [Bacteroidota bacterium]
GYSFGYTAGFNLEIGFKRASRFRLRPGIFLTSKKGKAKEEFTIVTRYTTYNLLYLQVPASFCYYFSHRDFSPFLSAGAVYGFALRNEINIRKVNEVHGIHQEYTERIQKPEEVGFNFGAGLRFKLTHKIHPIFEYQYERTNTVNPAYPLRMHKILLGIQL